MQTANRPVALTPTQFLAATRAKTSKVISNAPYVDGGNTRWQLPQAGLASSLTFNIQGTILVAGTVTGGTFNTFPYPAPLSIIKRVQLFSNTSFYLRDLTGWGWYKWIRTRYGIDPFAATASPFSANSLAYLGINAGAGNKIVAGANVVAGGTYIFNYSLPMPISYNRQAETGLLVLQQNATYYTISIDWGQLSGGISATGGSNDLITGLTGTGLSVTAIVSVSIGLDWFETIAGIDDLTSLFVAVSESIAASPITTGDNIIKLPLTDFYTLMIWEIINNAAPVAVANIQNPRLTHSGQVIDFTDDYAITLTRDYFHHAACPPIDGCVMYDLGIRQGNLSHRDALDAFNNRNITDATFTFTIPSTLAIAGKNQVTAVYESLKELLQ